MWPGTKILLLSLRAVCVVVPIATVWCIANFVVGEYAHPMVYVSSIDSGTAFKFFARFISVPTFPQDGIFTFILWPMYYLSGITAFGAPGTILTVVATFITDFLHDRLGITAP